MNDIKDRAEYYQNLHIIDDEVKAVVMMENLEDKKFWDIQLQKCSPGNYHFVGYDNESGDADNMPGGCTECIKYKDFLTDYFFLCIDTDLNQILGASGMTASDHIFQTYTYSWENHCCESVSLQAAVTSACPIVASKFDFSAFLHDYSDAVYEPLLILIACAKAGRTDFTIRKFCSCVPKQCTKSEMNNNGQGLIKKIRSNFHNAIPVGLKAAIDMTKAKNACAALNIDASNAYLHTRGHDIFNLIRYIGWQLCKKEPVKFDKDILEKNMNSTCWEMKAIEADLHQIHA